MSHVDNVPPAIFALPRSQWGPRDNGLNWPAPPGLRNSYRPPHRDMRRTRPETGGWSRDSGAPSLTALPEEETVADCAETIDACST